MPDSKKIEMFARHLNAESSEGAMACAKSRGWLTDSGAVTREGEELLRALEGQQETRSVFRTF